MLSSLADDGVRILAGSDFPGSLNRGSTCLCTNGYPLGLNPREDGAQAELQVLDPLTAEFVLQQSSEKTVFVATFSMKSLKHLDIVARADRGKRVSAKDTAAGIRTFAAELLDRIRPYAQQRGSGCTEFVLLGLDANCCSEQLVMAAQKELRAVCVGDVSAHPGGTPPSPPIATLSQWTPDACGPMSTRTRAARVSNVFVMDEHKTRLLKPFRTHLLATILDTVDAGIEVPVKYLELGASVPVSDEGAPLTVLSWGEFVNVASSESLNLSARNTAALLLELGQAYATSPTNTATDVVIFASLSSSDRDNTVSGELSRHIGTVVRSRGLTTQINDVQDTDTERRSRILDAAMCAHCIVLVLDDGLAAKGLSASIIPAILSRQHAEGSTPSILVVVPEDSKVARDACVDPESMINENVMIMAYDKGLTTPQTRRVGRSPSSDTEVHQQLAALQSHAAAIAQEIEVLTRTTQSRVDGSQSQPQGNGSWITFDVVRICSFLLNCQFKSTMRSGSSHWCWWRWSV
eukprot:m.1174003 g.1174003  ORF g.1174003 m.1174003 type:complete len:520 (+) comp24521_c0_seq26:2651-4210(+)